MSTSFHELGQLRGDWGAALDYAFLSPVFDSISKEGYGAAFEETALTAALSSTTMPIVALGGKYRTLSRHVPRIIYFDSWQGKSIIVRSHCLSMESGYLP